MKVSEEVDVSNRRSIFAVAEIVNDDVGMGDKAH